MRRREFVLALGGAMISARRIRAQQKAMPVIGFLNGGSADKFAPYFAAFRAGLAAMGYVEGQNVAIEYRNAEGHYDRLPAGGSPCRTDDKIRDGHQSQDRQGARPDDPAIDPRPRRRVDRMTNPAIGAWARHGTPELLEAIATPMARHATGVSRDLNTSLSLSTTTASSCMALASPASHHSAGSSGHRGSPSLPADQLYRRFAPFPQRHLRPRQPTA